MNATTISSHCGLLPNITYSVDAGMINVNSSIEQGLFFSVGASYPWSDQVQVLTPFWSYPSENTTGVGDDPGVVLMVSTLLDIEPSVQQEFAVPVTWPIGSAGVNGSEVIDQYVVDVYFVQCSLSAVTTEAVLDIQTNSLWNPVSVDRKSVV